MHFVVCGRAGQWLIVDFQNGYQPDFKRLQPKTRDPGGNHSAYLEPGGKRADGHQVILRFVIERSPFQGVPASGTLAGTPFDPKRCLGPRGRASLTGQILKLAEQETRACKTDRERIRALYDYVERTMLYSKHGAGWGRGDALWACDSKYGNCTDFHSVIIGMARSLKIPARFLIGFPMPSDNTEATIDGYHFRAELYVRQISA